MDQLQHTSEHLFAALDNELHRLAESHLRRSNAPRGATTLLHEAYVNVVPQRVPSRLPVER